MISLLFCGDFAPVERFEKLTIKKGAFIFGDLLKEINQVDISFINLEAPSCRTNSPIIKSGPVLKVSPKCLKSLSDSGFDVVGIANNHILDHGELGLLETIEACKKHDLNYVGAGNNMSDAQKPLILERKNSRIAIIAVTEHEFSIASELTAGAAPLDPIDNTYQIKSALNDSDLVFVTIHGGNEHFPYPRPGLRKICKYFIDLGVDGIIYHHQHIPGAYEFYNGKPIVYSLGNIIFDRSKPMQGWCEGYGVRIDFDEQNKKLISFNILPYHQSTKIGGVKLLKDKEKDIFIEKIDKYNSILKDQIKFQKEWTKFCAKKEHPVLISSFLPNSRFFAIIAKFLPINKILIPNKTISIKLNLFRCESHLELLQSILERKYRKI